MIDEERLEGILEAAKDFKTVIMPRTRQAIRALIAGTPEDLERQCRLEYLEECITSHIISLDRLMDRYEDYRRRDRVLERLLTGEDIQALEKEIDKLRREAVALKRPEKATNNRVDDDSIRRAREYPFTTLLEFRMNQARCPFHEDKTPSLHLYQAENRAHCFSCGKGWDPIGLVMDRDGLTFPEAVRRLQ